MAGTINTTNYGFKKYAPEDTVSMLQTFNGNMDGIDAAIKARQDENTVMAANLQKVEQGLTTVNEAINTTNNTVAAQNVQIQTNKQNITAQGIEIKSLDVRVSALEDGGENIENIILQSNMTNYAFSIKKQGNKFFGFISTHDSVVTSRTTKVLTPTNFNGSYTIPQFLIASASGNLFNLNDNSSIVVGSCTAILKSSEVVSRVCPLIAMYDGVNTGFYAYGTTGAEFTTFSYSAIVDYVL